MNGYGVRLEVKQGEVKEIIDKLNEAQETILDCYEKLYRVGV